MAERGARRGSRSAGGSGRPQRRGRDAAAAWLRQLRSSSSSSSTKGPAGTSGRRLPQPAMAQRQQVEGAARPARPPAPLPGRGRAGACASGAGKGRDGTGRDGVRSARGEPGPGPLCQAGDASPGAGLASLPGKGTAEPCSQETEDILQARGGKNPVIRIHCAVSCKPRQPACSSWRLAGALLPSRRRESAVGDATSAWHDASMSSLSAWFVPVAQSNTHPVFLRSMVCNAKGPFWLWHKASRVSSYGSSCLSHLFLPSVFCPE
ncbi:myosin heavy chain IB-like [Molothrus ater]|uniref:myosin heavy chain IB-like n=1 Tax=Molothrus ater TaxID=84834 RepID=UPI00174A193D|nr:myosin heavy chain IB-like [Molothrus ater]